MPYIPHTDDEIKEMLKTTGLSSVDDLFSSIPNLLRENIKINISNGISEFEIKNKLEHISNENKIVQDGLNFLGAGSYRHYIPAAVTSISQRSEFVTPYTPYQPEISQGTLQAIFEYQSLICRLFEMDVSNASHYDCATSLVEAILIALRIGVKRKVVALPRNIHPEYAQIVRSLLAPTDAIIKETPISEILNDDLACAVFQFPNFFGIVEDLYPLVEAVHKAGAMAIAVIPEPICLGILNPPGKCDFDIAVGEGMGLGMQSNFGGPTLGIFTAKEKYLRHMPGRICGETVDSKGRRSYVLTMCTREQHIRRSKATSNICSNQALCATTAAIYLSMLGKNGLKELSLINASRARSLLNKLTMIKGIKQRFNADFFNEFVIDLPVSASELVSALNDKGIYAGVDLGKWFPDMKNSLLVCCTELNGERDIDRLAKEMSNYVA